MEHADSRNSVLIFATSLGDRACVRPLRWSMDVIAHTLGFSVDFTHGPRLGYMSDAWLREHEAEFEKHSAGQ